MIKIKCFCARTPVSNHLLAGLWSQNNFNPVGVSTTANTPLSQQRSCKWCNVPEDWINHGCRGRCMHVHNIVVGQEDRAPSQVGGRRGLTPLLRRAAGWFGSRNGLGTEGPGHQIASAEVLDPRTLQFWHGACFLSWRRINRRRLSSLPHSPSDYP